MEALGCGDTVTDFEMADLGPDFLDCPGNLVPQNQRHLHTGFQGAVACHNIMEADTAGMDPDHNLAGRGLGLGNILAAQYIDTSRLTHHQCFHHASSPYPFRQSGLYALDESADPIHRIMIC